MIYSLDDFNFDLPPDQIAAEALEIRSASRMLVVDRDSGTFGDSRFADLDDWTRPGDLLVLNNTKVFPARLFGTTSTGARVEIFLVEEVGVNSWSVLARPAKRLAPGKKIHLSPDLAADVVSRGDDGTLNLEFYGNADLRAEFDKLGRTPLPPYIKRDSTAPDLDCERYQTVYAKERGAIAAPTAGLHFTPEILARLRGNGVEIAEITLHVGYGTFEPIRTEKLEDHRVSPERFVVSELAADQLERARTEGRRIIAVGTTTTRTLEYLIRRSGTFEPASGRADLTILPGFEFRAIQGLLTNFHLPMSSLLVLVSTFGGHELIMNAYEHAVGAKYRFYSYGDCMLIL